MNANKQDAGGLPATGPFVDRLIRIFRDKPHDDTSALVLLEYGELCRAAPAGGDEPDVLHPQYRHGFMEGMKFEGEHGLMTTNAPKRDSAPAGSGEVGALIDRLEAAAGAYPEDVFPSPTAEERALCGHVIQGAAAAMGRHMAPMLLEAAALLRKLQQGADEGRSRAYDQVDRFLRNNLGDEAYAEYSEALEVACGYAASHGQEGGHAGG